jgi:hypothetical protein
MLTRVRRGFGVELTLRNVFETPSLGELAQLIDQRLAVAPETETQGATLTMEALSKE